LAMRKRLGQGGEPARKTVQDGEAVQRDRFQAGVPAATLGLLPKRLGFAGQCQVVLRPKQDQVVNDGRFGVEGSELDAKVLGLGRPAPQKQAYANFPGLAVLTNPVADADRAVGWVLAECPFRYDVL